MRLILLRDRALILALGLAIAANPAIGWGKEAEQSKVRFETSCKPDTQEQIDRAVTLLHSFEYPETTRRFKEIRDTDPLCAMAYWGSAMSLWHPLWAPPGNAQLKEGAALLATAAKLTSTPRETEYINALTTFFSDGDNSSHRDRALRYEQSMSAVYSNNLDDPEAAMFYALALLASADPRDKSYAHQFKSAALLNWVRVSHPTHPGVLHYLIHSYDYPALAHLALDAATTYADAAPDSAHAQHMPSHIFTRLGLWERSLSSNHDSTRSAAEYTVKAHLPGHYDEGLHSIDYLMYAMLQTARDDDAKQLLGRLGDIKKTDTENFKVAFSYASAPARYALERRMWGEASELKIIREDFAWDDFLWARSIHHFARGIGSARSGQPDKARQELGVLNSLFARLPTQTPTYFRTEVEVQIDAVESWIMLAEGNTKQALSRAAEAAELEDAVDKHPVTPGEVLPARELYADMLFETGNHAQSLEQYRIVLTASPNRLNSLLGAAKASVALGNPSLTAHFLRVIQMQTQNKNGQRVGLDEFERLYEN
jgi:hypothetical protein